MDSKWKPDWGPSKFSKSVKNSGATAIAARDFLVAYNINLNTTSTRRANAIAFDIRTEMVSLEEFNDTRKNIIKNIDILGREINHRDLSISIYDDYSVEKKYVIK